MPKETLMEDFTKEDLSEALRAITSLLGKCEKAQEKLRQGTSQWSLTKNRIKALRVSEALIRRALDELGGE